MNILCKCGLHRFRPVRETSDNLYEECDRCPARKYTPVADKPVPVIDFRWLTEGGRVRLDPMDKVFTIRKFDAAPN